MTPSRTMNILAEAHTLGRSYQGDPRNVGQLAPPTVAEYERLVADARSPRLLVITKELMAAHPQAEHGLLELLAADDNPAVAATARRTLRDRQPIDNMAP